MFFTRRRLRYEVHSQSHICGTAFCQRKTKVEDAESGRETEVNATQNPSTP